MLRLRAAVLADIRSYFDEQGVVEVTTPVVGRHGSTDPALKNIRVDPFLDAAGAADLFLQTSPEVGMKRLLAAGVGDIYQICAVFRGDELGRIHLPEFQLLEWYRLGFDHHALMDDVQALVSRVVPACAFTRLTHAEVFRWHTGLDPHVASTEDLAARAAGVPVDLSPPDRYDRALLLDLLFGQVVMPGLAAAGGLFIYDFPVEQAAYARLRPGPPAVAERFELILDGIELANGYHELCDAAEQRRRQVRENLLRRQRGLETVALDGALSAALQAGLPDCAGVALGLDRLLMCRAGVREIAEVVSFGAELGPWK